MGANLSSDEAKNSSHQEQPLNNHPNNNVKSKEAVKVLPRLPHNCEAIIKDSDRGIDKSSVEKLYEQLHAGVYLNGKRKKYWVEKKDNINCFMVYANDLSITWVDNPKYWYLHNMETSEDGNITVAQLRNVCWLEVHGKLNIANLTPGITYQISYLIKLENSAYGWEVPINLSLSLPNGIKQQHKVCLKEKPKEEWVRIPAGEFKVSPENLAGEVEFSLYEYEGGNWKRGLVIKGALIVPKV